MTFSKKNVELSVKNSFCRISVVNMYILFCELSAVNSAIVLIDMFQKWLQLPTGGKVAELQGL